MVYNIRLDEETEQRLLIISRAAGCHTDEMIKKLIDDYYKSFIRREAFAMNLGFVKEGVEQDQGKSDVVPEELNDDNYCKAKRKMKKWAYKKEGTPHKIIRAFLLLESNGEVDLYEMRELCTNEDRPDVYVGDYKKFDANFSQLKYDSDKSHGHVFDSYGNKVTIWNEMLNTINYYREQFVEM